MRGRKESVEDGWAGVRRVYEKARREDRGGWSGGRRVCGAVRGLVEGVLGGCRVGEEVGGEMVEVLVEMGGGGGVDGVGDEVWLEREGRGGRVWAVPGEGFLVPVF